TEGGPGQGPGGAGSAWHRRCHDSGILRATRSRVRKMFSRFRLRAGAGSAPCTSPVSRRVARLQHSPSKAWRGNHKREESATISWPGGSGKSIKKLAAPELRRGHRRGGAPGASYAARRGRAASRWRHTKYTPPDTTHPAAAIPSAATPARAK